MHRILTAIAIAFALIAVLVLLSPARAVVGAGMCPLKVDVIAEVYRQSPNALVTDLAGPLEEIMAQNLARVESQDISGRDIVLFRFPGKGVTTVALFRGGCYERHLSYPNPFVQILLSLPKEQEA